MRRYLDRLRAQEPEPIPPRGESLEHQSWKTNYRHTPLGDPTNIFRLLHMSASDEIRDYGDSNDRNGDKIMRFQLSSWNRDSAPEYFAISYAWGNPLLDRKTVYINGKPHEVGSACHYALKQSLRPRGYLWIDSICIDQDNLIEKGHQVAMMGDIFARAKVTYACIGPQFSIKHDLLEELVRLWRSMGEHELGKPSAYNTTGQIEAQRWWELWCMDHPRDVSRLLFVIREFVARPYWKRLWIIQELVLSQNAVICFGESRQPWRVMRMLAWLGELSVPVVSAKGMRQFSKLASLSYDQEDGPLSLGENVVGFECSDVRDNVYGILGIIAWPEGLPRIAPDYTLSPFQLAASLVEGMGVGRLTQLLRMLDISMGDADMSELVNRRRRAAHRTSSYDSTQSGRSKVQGRLEADDMLWMEVSADAQGHLTCSLQKDQGDLNAGELNHRYRLLRKIHDTENDFAITQKPCTIYINDEPAAVVCSGIQVGDHITAARWQRGTLLVLRHLKDDLFELIGQGFTFPGFRACQNGVLRDQCTCRQSGIKHNAQWVRAELDLSDQDLVILAGQDLLPAGSGSGSLEYDDEKRFARVFTRVSSREGAQARFIGNLYD